MDTLTHALSGALLARAAQPARARSGALSPQARVLSAFAAAAFPDCDFALRLVDTLTYLNWHQGVTHSVVLAPAWAWLLARFFSFVSRRRYAPSAFFGMALLGIAAHIAGDVLTAYGTMLFAPFSTQRFSVPWIFVVDPYFSGILAGGMALTALKPARRSGALIALIVLAGYVALAAALHQRALRVGAEYAAAQGRPGARIEALAQPLTPFNRTIIVVEGDLYHVAMVNLWRRRPAAPPDPAAGALRRIAGSYEPVSSVQWKRYRRFGENAPEIALAREAWSEPVFAGFRRFAAFPVLDRVDAANGRVCVWFIDLRFLLPALPPSFRYGLCREGSPGDWRLVQWRGLFWID